MKYVLIGSYLFFFCLLAAFSYLFIDVNIPSYHWLYSGFATGNRTITSFLFLIFISALFIIYGIVFTKKVTAWWLVGIPCVVLLFAYPAMLSFDIFNYLATAKVLFYYTENPYLIMPIAFVGDPMLLYTHAANKVALYGPIWILLTGIPYVIGMGNLFVTLISFKLVVIVCYLLTLYLLWLFTKQRLPVLLFALNPLVLIEVLLSGHNDIVMMCFALGALYFVKKKRFVFALMLFVVSILIKYATLFLIPVLVYLLYQSYRKKEIVWDHVFFFSACSMFLIFLLSPIREEMYPWYAVWFLPFVFLLPKKKVLISFAIAFSFGLLLRYLPFMYTGSHSGMTPLLRILLACAPVMCVGLYVGVKKWTASLHKQ